MVSDEVAKAMKSLLSAKVKCNQSGTVNQPDTVGLHLAETSSTLASHLGRGGGEADGEGVDFICQRQISFNAAGNS